MSCPFCGNLDNAEIKELAIKQLKELIIKNGSKFQSGYRLVFYYDPEADTVSFRGEKK